jgi:hypothetical protein
MPVGNRDAALIATIDDYFQFLTGHLGGQVPVTEDESLGIADLKDALATRVLLPPRLTPLPITADYFAKAELATVPVEVAALMRDFRFYFVAIPINLVKGRRLHFAELEVLLAYSPALEKAIRPTTHDLFPASKWQKVLEIGGNLDLGINAKLQFAIDSKEAVPGLGIQAEPLVKVGAFLKLTPPILARSRSLILSEGIGNVYARWVFKTREIIEEAGELRLVLIVQIPRTTTTFTIVPEVRAKFDYAMLRNLFARILGVIEGSLATLRARFGDQQVDQTVSAFHERLAKGFETAIPARLAWDLSEDLAQHE